MKLREDEIVEGIVIYFEPDDLLTLGVVCTTFVGTPTYGSHYFVCTGVDEIAGTSEWIPLLSRPGQVRRHIPNEAKTGDRRFVEPDSYYCPFQFWRGKNKAFIIASERDRSSRSLRNRIRLDIVDEIVGALEAQVAVRERKAG